MKIERKQISGFTLMELLTVLGIISLLAALLFPVLAVARGSARRAQCLSHLRQIGMAVSLYAQDYDGFYPYALNPSDHAHPEKWSDHPEFQARIPTLRQFHEVLQPYLSSTEILHCASDTGWEYANPYPGWGLPASSSSFAQFGTSYFYRSLLAAEHADMDTLKRPSETIVLFDGDGKWHGSARAPLYEASALRYNTLFSDNHVANINHIDLARWDTTPL